MTSIDLDTAVCTLRELRAGVMHRQNLGDALGVQLKRYAPLYPSLEHPYTNGGLGSMIRT
jgi:hypothetical protein